MLEQARCDHSHGFRPSRDTMCFCSCLRFLFFVADCFLRDRPSGMPQVRPLLFPSTTRFLSLFPYQANRQHAPAMALAALRGCASFCSCGAFFHFPPALSDAMGLELHHPTNINPDMLSLPSLDRLFTATCPSDGAARPDTIPGFSRVQRIQSYGEDACSQ